MRTLDPVCDLDHLVPSPTKFIAEKGSYRRAVVDDQNAAQETSKGVKWKPTLALVYRPFGGAAKTASCFVSPLGLWVFAHSGPIFAFRT